MWKTPSALRVKFFIRFDTLFWPGFVDFQNKAASLGVNNSIKEVSLHAPTMCKKFQFKQKNMTNVACFHGQHFLCLEGI